MWIDSVEMSLSHLRCQRHHQNFYPSEACDGPYTHQAFYIYTANVGMEESTIKALSKKLMTNVLKPPEYGEKFHPYTRKKVVIFSISKKN